MPGQNYGREYTKVIYGFDCISKKNEVACVYCQLFRIHTLAYIILLQGVMIVMVGLDNSWRKLVFRYNVELHNATHTMFYDGASHRLIEDDPL